MSVIPVALASGLAALVAFALVETRRRSAGRFYLFDFTLWRHRGLRYGNLAGTIVSLGEFGLLFALPLFLQAVIGYSAFETGLVFLALAIGAFFAAPGAATFARRYGPRWVVTLGMALEAVGIVATTLLISTTVSGFMLAIPLFVYGIGVGFATAQLTSIVLSDVPVESSGIASGANSTLRQVGSALGIAILGTVLFSTLVSGSWPTWGREDTQMLTATMTTTRSAAAPQIHIAGGRRCTCGARSSVSESELKADSVALTPEGAGPKSWVRSSSSTFVANAGMMPCAARSRSRRNSEADW